MKLKLSESQDQILLAAITCSLLVLELAFVRLLDILLFPRITSTVITLSLFSFAIGGIYVARLSGQRKDLKDFIESAIFKYLWVCLGSLFVILMLRLPKNVVLTYDIYLFWFLLFLCLLISLPMSIGGAIVVAFFTKSHKVAKTYLFDMLGAGIGVSLFYGLFSPLGPTGLVSLSLFFVLIVCWWIGSEKKHWVGAMLLLPLVGLPILERSYSIRPLVNKMGGLDQGKEIDVSLWDQEGYLSLVSWNDDEDRSAQKVFLYDGGSMASTIYSFDGDYERLRNAFMEDPLKHFSRLTVPLAHYLQRDSHQKAFIIGSGAGQEVKAALMYGASEVVAVDVSRTVLDLSRGLLSGFNGGIYNHPNVRVYYGEGRSTLYTLKETFDIIQMFSLYSSSSLSDNRGALQAVYSLTVEAFKEYFLALSQKGVLQINKINFQRIVATAATAWKELGLTEFEKHVVVVERRRRDLFPTILIRRTPWTEQDLQDIQSYLNNHPSEGYRISVHPFEDSKKWYLKGGPTPERYARSHIDLRPTRDDRPFFSNNQKPFHRIERPSVLTEGRPEFNEVKVLKAMGPIDIIDVALIVFALAVLLLIMSSRHVDVSYILRNPLEASHLFFIGAGFIFIEFLFLYVFELISHSGQVTLVLVIGVLTLSAGLSQFLFRKWHWDEFFATPKIGFVLSVSLFLFGLLGVDRIGLLREISSYGMRYFVVILVISYFGVLLGHFFPAALKRMGERGKLEMGWILNALGFVVGGVCSIVLFQALGFRISCMILSGGYMISAGVTWMIQNRREKVPG